MEDRNTSDQTGDDLDGAPVDNIPEGTLQNVARKIKKYYVERRQQLFKKYSDSNASRWKSVWRQAAVLCIRKNIEPHVLVDTAFSAFVPFPHPNHLMSASVMRRLTDPVTQKELANEAILQFQSELDDLQQMVARGFSVLDAVQHPASQMSALFSYVLAVKFGFDHTLRPANLVAARAQLETAHPAYVHLIESMNYSTAPNRPLCVGSAFEADANREQVL